MDPLHNYVPSLDWIDTQQDRMHVLIEEWANINSGSDNIDGLAKMLSKLREAFSSLNGDMEAIALPNRQWVDLQGNSVQSPVGQMLTIRKRPHEQHSILLGGHMDTVFSPHNPFQTCQKIAPNTLQGPGVADMKGGLVIMLIALEALERSPFAKNLGWEIFINPDEEIGSMSSAAHLKAAATRHQLGLLFEPPLPDESFVSARKGTANYTLIARGKSAHVGRDFHLGRNAIMMLLPVLETLATLTNPLQGVLVNVGQIHGGHATNVVPDLAIARVGIRATTLEQLQSCKRTIREIVAMVPHEGVELVETSIREPKPFDTKTEALFKAVQNCANELGIHTQWKETGGVCDGNILSAAGLPTIDTLGAVGGNIHTKDEFVRLDRLTERAKLAALILMRFASQTFSWSKE